MTYLVEKYARKDTLYPKSPALRAKINQQLYFDYELYKLLEAVHAEPVFSGTPTNEETVRQASEKLDSLEYALAAHEYVAGDQLTVADIALATSISTADAFGHDFSGYPHIGKWFARCKSEIAGYEEINQHGLDKLKVILANAEKDRAIVNGFKIKL
jgi:glutathione S-transferase